MMSDDSCTSRKRFTAKRAPDCQEMGRVTCSKVCGPHEREPKPCAVLVGACDGCQKATGDAALGTAPSRQRRGGCILLGYIEAPIFASTRFRAAEGQQLPPHKLAKLDKCGASLFRGNDIARSHLIRASNMMQYLQADLHFLFSLSASQLLPIVRLSAAAAQAVRSRGTAPIDDAPASHHTALWWRGLCLATERRCRPRLAPSPETLRDGAGAQN